MKMVSFFLVLALSTLAFAQEQEADREPAQEQTDAKGRYVVDESYDNRKGKQWHFAVNLTGIGPSLTSTTGIVGAYHLSQDQMILLEATSGKAGFNLEDTDKVGSEYEITSKSFGVHYKQFTGNSFYFRTGVDFRSADYKYTYTSTNPANNSDIRFKGTSVAANFQIGNQWQWENFTLGCDWVGITLPMTSKVTDEYVFNGTFAGFDREQLKEDSETLIENSNLNLLRFYLGASF